MIKSTEWGNRRPNMDLQTTLLSKFFNDTANVSGIQTNIHHSANIIDKVTFILFHSHSVHVLLSSLRVDLEGSVHAGAGHIVGPLPEPHAGGLGCVLAQRLKVKMFNF